MGAETILVDFLGYPIWLGYTLYALDLILSALAMWRVVKLKQTVWAILLLIFRTAGILPIIYFIFFAKWKKKKDKKEKS